MRPKVFFIFFFISFIVFGVSAQTDFPNTPSNEILTYFIDKCLSLLDEPVTNEFRIVQPNNYLNDENISVITENNIVIVSMIVIVIPETYLINTFEVIISLLNNNYNFDNLTVGDNGFSITLRRGNINAKVQYQGLMPNNFAIVMGFSERDMKLF